MDLIKPIAIDLQSSTVSESAYDEYDSTHTYAVDDIVYVSFELDGTTDRTPHEIYVSVAGPNTDNYPPDLATKWVLVGSTNKWKMFDEFVNTQTVDTTTITVEIDASATNSVGLFGLVGKTVTLTLYASNKGYGYGDYYEDEAGNIYGETVIKKTEIIDLDDSPIYDYYDYFFGEFSYKSDIFWSYPYYYSGAALKIEIEPYQNETACGICALGKSNTLGNTQWGPTIGLSSYSKKDIDSLGRTYLNKGNNAKNLDFDFWIRNLDVDTIRRILAGIDGIPVVINANGIDTNYESLIIYGYTQNFEIIIPGPARSKCSFEAKGLI